MMKAYSNKGAKMQKFVINEKLPTINDIIKRTNRNRFGGARLKADTDAIIKKYFTIITYIRQKCKFIHNLVIYTAYIQLKDTQYLLKLWHLKADKNSSGVKWQPSIIISLSG